MPRKRMISPELWSSEGFGNLSTFAKVVYIGLISSADDEGRGRCKPSLLRSTLFPYDERLRTSDIDRALEEIEQHTSTMLYTYDGQRYYFLRNWKKWQKIDKPSRSQIPPPPGEDPREPEQEEKENSQQQVKRDSEYHRADEEAAAVLRALNNAKRTEKEQLTAEDWKRKLLKRE
ncbi:MAG: hypothetical protein IJO09_06520 [Oscillospiraceae bacterium]|nr:hypothetical protein [Oscillospiraceae bacterium]